MVEYVEILAWIVVAALLLAVLMVIIGGSVFFLKGLLEAWKGEE